MQKNKKLTYKQTTQSKPIMRNFAKYFDLIYHDKNYESECKFITSCIEKFGITHSKTILDLACGTGQHGIILAKKKFQVTGIDISQAAIEIARKKANTLKIKTEFLQNDMTNFNLNKKFDVCISMFSSFCYLLYDKQIIATLNNVKNHLNPRGIFIFDFWNGSVVKNELPTTRIKDINLRKKRILRIAVPSTNYKKNRCAINYHCIIIDNKKVVDEFTETHTMRFHFPKNLTKILENVGFEILKITTINDIRLNHTTNISSNWYLTIIARKN